MRVRGGEGGRCSLTQGRRKAGLGVCGCDAQTGHTGAPTPTEQSKGPTSKSQPSWPDSSPRLGCEPSGQVTSLSLSFSNCKTHGAGGPSQSRPTGAPEAPCRPVCPLETVALTSPRPLAEPRVQPLRDRGPGPLGKAKHGAYSRCLIASGVNYNANMPMSWSPGGSLGPAALLLGHPRPAPRWIPRAPHAHNAWPATSHLLTFASAVT